MEHVVPTRDEFDVAILGGGVSGLTAAYNLARAGLKPIVFEKDTTLGGLARSIELESYSIEVFYHHYFKTDRDVFDLIAELGIADKLVVSRVRQGVYVDSHTRQFSTPLDLLLYTPLPLRERILLGLLTQGLIGDESNLDQISAEDWIIRNVGQTAYDKLIKPLLKVKFGYDGSVISAAFVRGRLVARGKSRGKGKWYEELGYLDGGTDLLISKLMERLEHFEVKIVTGAAVTNVKKLSNSYQVEITVEKEMFSYITKDVVSSIPTPVLSNILSDFPHEFEETLESIDYRPVIVAALGLKRSVTPYYWVSVVDRNVPFNALIEHTHLHDPENYNNEHVIYLGRYLSREDELWSYSDSEIVDSFTDGLALMNPSFNASEVLWSSVSRDSYATPIFKIEYGKVLEHLSEKVPGFHLAGPLTVYPDSRNVNSAVRIGKEISQKILKRYKAGSSSLKLQSQSDA